jgi:thiol:disulfide interchange protein DsbD
LPPGLTAGPIEWPAPKRLESGSIVDYGYEDAVLLMVPIHVEVTLPAQSSARIDASAKLLICSREMCVPGQADLSLTLPIKQQVHVADPRNGDLFIAARKSLPKPTRANWKFSVTDENGTFVLSGKLGHEVKQAVFFPLADSQIANAAPQVLQSTSTGFRLKLGKSDQLLQPIQRLKGVLVFGAQPYLIDAPVSKQRAARNSSDSEVQQVKSQQQSPQKGHSEGLTI